MKDYYKILGVDKKSTKDEIKKSYRNLSKKFHPDVNPDGTEKFKEIAEAYDVLSDDNKRKQYDNPNPFGNMRGGFNPFEDFINNFNNGGRQQKRRGPDKKVKIQLNPIESYFGINKPITYQTNNSCQSCEGSGGKKNVCQECQGSGNIRRKVGTGFFTQVIDTPCMKCNGTGDIVIDACFNCGGSGIKQKIEQIGVDIPKNINNGDFLRVQGKGDFSSKNGYGDLIIQIEVLPQDGFEKINNDLIYTKKVSMYDLVIGKEIILPHPDGDLIIKLPYNTESVKPLRLKGKGYKTNNGNGDFYFKLNVVNEPLTEEIKNELIEFLK
jgi:molecular chaperone DnaJ